ncbi:hypothetical protein [Corynebacterium cystitidis]|uniref:hypothetical protein n=1 Tax=Corynebacterium cystitidis TaxID=35757 RepID=UPI00211E5D13|nr:hypothetical protein [Corynebacterium cystitidis]
MATTIKLQAGKTQEIDAQDLQIQVEAAIKPAENFQLTHPVTADARYSPRTGILVRNITAPTALEITPADGPRFSPTAQAHCTVVIRSQDLRIELPALAIGDRQQATIATFEPAGNAVIVTAPLPTGQEGLEGSAATVRRSVGTQYETPVGTPKQSPQRPLEVLVVMDSSASFATFLSDDQRRAISIFAGGVLGDQQFKTRIVAATDAAHAGDLSSPADVDRAFTDIAGSSEIGWTRSPDQFLRDGLDTAGAVVVIGDDLPGEFLHLEIPVHVLSTQRVTPPVPANVSVTEFDTGFVAAVLNDDPDVIRDASRAMLAALTTPQEV